jgi:hypothetical protein
LRRSERCGRNRRRDRERVDHQGICVREHGQCSCRDQKDASEVRIQQDLLAGIAIAEHPGKRGDESGRNQTDEEDEPDGLLAADRVGVDGNGDEERVVADDRRRPRELEPTQIRVAPDGRERGGRLPQTASDSTHGRQHLIGTCGMKEGEGRFRNLARSGMTEPRFERTDRRSK